MRVAFIVTAAIMSLSAFATPGFSDEGKKMDAKAEFEKHCAACHPKGGNIMKADKTLGKKSLADHGIKTSKDIIAKMRNPGPGMTKFDEKTIPAKEAKLIADYILKTFK
jgi:cytochrome c6